MINLSLLSKCSSLKNKYSLSGSLSFCTDTRKYLHPSVFVAIPGSKTNPLDIIEELLTQGCPVVIYQENDVNQKKVENLKKNFTTTDFIPVTDSVTFLQEVSHFHINEWKEKNNENIIFAISGSNGKTTHKEMLSFLLNEVLPGKVVSTEKNNNNHLGVPLTLLKVTDETQFVVLELGSNHPGEIKVLCDIAHPNSGLTTNIGATHMEFFGTEQKVFEEEGYLYHAIKEISGDKGLFLINLDDPFLKNLAPTLGSITYGEHHAADAKVIFLENGAEIHYKNQKFVATNPFITGKHNKLNLITCLFIASYFYPFHKVEFTEACRKFRPTKNRSEWIEFDHRQVYLDAYNANPSSMKAALQGFKESILAQGLNIADSCVVLGDMYELGDSTHRYHKEVAQYVKDLGFPNVYFVGHYSADYLDGFPEGKSKRSIEEFKNEYRNECLKKFTIHFIKGSRSLQLESLFDIT
jgi:UDP-N-acetylmuramoyl-tripeptide--D-alanyl-D-alanine ligase